MLRMHGMMAALVACALVGWATQLQAQESEGPPWGTYSVYGYGAPAEAELEAKAAAIQRLEQLEDEIPPGFSIGTVQYMTSDYVGPYHIITFRVWLTPDLDPRP